MKKENWQKAFSEIPEDYNRRLNGTLNNLTEAPERRFMHKPMLVLAAALVLLLGIAAAAGTSNLFNIFGKTPLEGAEDGIIRIDSEPVVINDELTAKIDYAYYDGVDFYYEMTLTPVDPQKCIIFSSDLSINNYVPEEDVTYLHITPYLFDFFEFTAEFGEEYEPENYDMEHYIEPAGDGTYSLYGKFHYENPAGVTLPDEIDLDVTLEVRRNPTVEDFHLIDPIEAELPFHVTKTAPTGSYSLIPITPPTDWNLTSAEYTQSKVSGAISLEYNFGGPVIEKPLHNSGTAAEQTEEDCILASHTYIFRLIDPDTGSVITESLSNWSNYEFFFCEIETPPMTPVPETFTLEVVYEEITIVDTIIDENGDEVFELNIEEVSLGTIEFEVTRN